jgi:hypothetical protein
VDFERGGGHISFEKSDLTKFTSRTMITTRTTNRYRADNFAPQLIALVDGPGLYGLFLLDTSIHLWTRIGSRDP